MSEATSMKEDSQFVEAIARGLKVLSALTESESELTLTQLSQRLGSSKSTMQRLTYTLQRLGYLDRNPETKKFRFGPKALTFAFSVIRGFDLRKAARPYLERVSREIGETVNLAILDGPEIVYVERIKTEQILNINLHVGSRLPAYCTSMGKAMLAFLPENQLENILGETEFQKQTPSTVVSKETLRQELALVRKRGFATNNEELSLGLRSVSAPIRNFTGEVVAAVNISVPSIRISKDVLETTFAQKVVETTNAISRVLGYQVDRPGVIETE
jgi:PcaR/PcaU/PobR family beta-ketoadipate pathway transcriptional regulator